MRKFKKCHNNESGALDVILVLLIVIALGVAAVGLYLRDKNNRPMPNPAPVSKVAPKAKPTQAAPAPAARPPYIPKTDSKTGWKIYTSSYEGISFEFPPNWKFDDTPGGLDSPDGDLVQLTAPDGFSLTFSAPLSGIGGACNPDTDPHNYIDQIVPLSVRAKNQLYQILIRYQGHKALGVVDLINGKAPVIGDTGACLYYPAFLSRTDNPQVIQFSTTVQNALTSDSTDKLTDDQYLAQPDVKTAEQIFKSLKY